MARCARQLNDNGIYHVMLRGNDHQKIFADLEDKDRVVAIISDKKEGGRYFLYAYCVMDNHLHLVIKAGADNLSRVMKRIATSYALYFNQKYKRSGHVFQDRYKSENVADEIRLLGAIRYLHQRPEKAGTGTAESYRWSSYAAYLKPDSSLVDTEEVLKTIAVGRKKAVREFKKMHQDMIAEGFIDVTEKKEIDEAKIRELIEGYLREQRTDLKGLKGPHGRELRGGIIKTLQEKTGLSLRGIARELGMNREMVRLAIMSEEPSPRQEKEAVSREDHSKEPAPSKKPRRQPPDKQQESGQPSPNHQEDALQLTLFL